ncbi:MAG: cobalamin-independent methionine synthase II family protein [Jatrophihabitans sp.]
MTIPTEPIGSIPRPPALLQGMADFAAGTITGVELDGLFDDALRDTISRFEATGSPIITDGEQTKSSFLTYPLDGMPGLAAGGVAIPFEDGHQRQLPVLTAGPFAYQAFADSYLAAAQQYASVPVKQAVIAPSALSLLYPSDGIEGYPQDQFLADLADQAERDIRRCLDRGADSVQLDFTEGRLSIKLDPSKAVLGQFVALNNLVLDRFTHEERAKIGVHTCPGGDQDSTHSLDIDYAELLPSLFQLRAGRFYVQLASEADPRRVLSIVGANLRPEQRVFVGVTDPINPVIETAEQVRDRVLVAAEYIPEGQLGTCDDCGFSPFGDDTSTSRDTAFAKIKARVDGTALAAKG